MEDISKAFNKTKKQYLSPKIKTLIDSLIAVEFNASQLYKSAPTSIGFVGHKAYSATHEYTCIATNTWARVALETTW